VSRDDHAVWALSAYARCWWVVVSVLILGGLVLAFLVMGQGLLPLAVAAGLVACCVSALLRAGDGATRRQAWRHVAAGTGRGAAATCAAVGWLYVAGPAVLLLAVLALVLSPRAVASIRSRLGEQALRGAGGRVHGSQGHDRPAEAPGLGAEEIARATTAQIVVSWHASGESLRRPQTAAAALELVELRQLCLDELERRDQTGLHCWLAEGASAGGDPTRFFGPDRRTGGAAA
jgi:hypothetical protein